MRYKYIGAIGAFLIAIVCLLSGLMYYFNQDTCPVGTFLCHNTTTCLPQRNWCDQLNQCPYGDDEQNCYDYHGVLDWFGSDRDSEAVREFVCDATDIPVGCKYVKCRATCQGYTEIPRNLSTQTTSITLYDSSIKRVPTGAFARYSEIRILYLDGSDIHELGKGAFLNLTKLFWLALDNNQISELRPGHFAGLTNLESLRANKNRITMADFSDLEGSDALNFINLNENQLTSKGLRLPELPALNEILLDENNFETIPDTLFAGCPSLKLLSMQKNRIKTIEGDTFQNLEQLVELNLAFNEITSVPLNVFQPLKNLTRLQLGYNRFHNLPMAVLTPLTRLYSLDLEGINLDTLQKNAFDTFEQLDFVYFKKFHYCATYAPRAKRCRPTSDGVSSLSHLLDKTLLRAAVWVISCVTCMGNVLVLWGRFTAKDENRVLTIIIRNLAVIHWRSSTRFYGVNGMCFPLHIDDPYLIGWEYSAFVFLGLNLTGLLVIGYAYAAMFVSVWRTRHACSLSVGDSEFALRFFLIVLTDAACWAPIIILKIRAMMRYPISADLHAWVVVFILPVNSAVNPLLYTFTTPKFRERLNDGWFAKVRNYMTRRKSSAKDSRTSTSMSNRNIMLSLSNGKEYINKIPPMLDFNKKKTQQTMQ
ncbi:relaxin receptor 1 isoform X4 [Frieseomelitta varia]|uniref:relaxin receptor 1 isoform X4 n=1 Tax=Frieseomelitta varia TaxID=561572 RepID=UPI001CB6981F|nr:relaxin receptor 1 isoform X4 [Frieseomelitta varia]